MLACLLAVLGPPLPEGASEGLRACGRACACGGKGAARTRTLVAGPSTATIELVRWMCTMYVDVLARLTSLGLRSSRVSFGGAALVLMLAGWLPCAYSTSNWDHLHANHTNPNHLIRPDPALHLALPCHCPSAAVRACALPPLRPSESPPSLTHVPHDVASSTRSLHLLPGLPAPPDRLFDR